MKRFSVTFFAALTLAAVATLFAPSAAQAHDEVVSTTPSADAKVAPGLLKLAVAFNEDVMNIPPHQGVSFSVTDPNGEPTLLSCVEISGTEIISAFDAVAVGTYTVDWRSVSSDGHENSGSYSFDVDTAAQAGEAPSPNAECEMSITSQTSNTAGELDLTTHTPTAATNEGGSKLDPLVGLGVGIGLFVVLSILGALAAEAQKRRRTRKAELKALKAEVEANPDLLRDL